MSEAIPEYILKKPISAEVRQRYDTENDEYSYWRIPVGDKYKVDLSKEVFNELFVPLDRQALRKQIRDIIEQDYSARPSSIEWIEAVRNEGLDETTDKIMRLFGLENTEPHFTGAGDAADFEVGDAVEWTRGESPVPIVTHEHNIKVGEIVRVENTGQTE